MMSVCLSVCLRRCVLQGRIYPKPGSVPKKCGGPMGRPQEFLQGGQPGGLGDGSPPLSPGGRLGEADGILFKWNTQTSFSVHWHNLQHERFLLHNPNFVVNFFKGNTSLVTDKWLSGNFGMLARCRNFFGPHVGAPFLWEPLFGLTCWTCLNTPLVYCGTEGRCRMLKVVPSCSCS